MPISETIRSMLADAPAWPGARNVPIETLRDMVRTSALALPKPSLAPVTTVDHIITGTNGDLPVRIYTPDGTGPFPVTLYFHGGGWVVGDLDTQDAIAHGLAAAASSIVISVDYRLAPEHPFPAATEDAWTALLWAHTNAPRWRGAPELLAVAGDSAGGTLACATALRARDAGGPVITAQVNWYGSCNFPSIETQSARDYANGPILSRDDVDYYWRLYLTNPEVQQHEPYASPVRAASHAALPAAFIVTAECDPSRDDTEHFAAKLAAAGTPVSRKRYPGMVHGFLSWSGFLPEARQAIEDAGIFLQEQFAKARKG